MLTPGDVILAFCPFISPPKNKYCLCICPVDRFFLFVNTNQYIPLAHGQVTIWKEELACLSYTSHVDVVSVFELPESTIKIAVSKGHVWPMQQSAKDRIKENAQSSRLLSPIYVRLLEKNF